MAWDRRRIYATRLRALRAEWTTARSIAVDSFIDMSSGPRKRLTVKPRGDVQVLGRYDLAETAAYYRILAIHVDTGWPVTESGDEREIELDDPLRYRQKRPRVLGYGRRVPMMPTPTGRRFEPWRCTCVCPAEWVWDPDRHDPTCGAFVPDAHHTEDGGSD